MEECSNLVRNMIPELFATDSTPFPHIINDILCRDSKVIYLANSV